MAAHIRSELGVDVTEESGSYGEFTVLVDGEAISHGNPIATAFAILPSTDEVVAEVKRRLGR